jgi:transcriptional regulator
MLIRPWDAALDEQEWRRWIAGGHDFGELAVNQPGSLPPIVVPTPFAPDGDQLLVHLARVNPVWSALKARPHVLMSVVDDDAFIPSTWRADAGGPDENDVPTSYYTAVQLVCRAEIVDQIQSKAELLRRQLATFSPRVTTPRRLSTGDLTARCSGRSAACACTSRALPPSSSTATRIRLASRSGRRPARSP